MIYRVVYTRRFHERVQAHVDYLLSEHAGIDTISNWYDQLFLLLDSLDELPKRFPLDERLTEETGTLTRKLNYGGYLVFYEVDEDNRSVNIIEFMHGAMRQ